MNNLPQPSSLPSPTQLREDMIQSAIRFLNDPKVQDAPLTKKISFLETKGLTNTEIQEAIIRIRGGSSSNTSVLPVSSYQQQQPTLTPQQIQSMIQMQIQHQQQLRQQQLRHNSWKEYVVAVSLTAAVCVGTWSLAKRYLGDLVSWPTVSKLETERDTILTQLTTTSDALDIVKSETTHVMKAVDSHATTVSEILTKLTTTINSIKESDTKRDEEIRAIQKDVESIKTMIPKVLEKSKETQNSFLTDLQTEIKSLKSLLLNRRFNSGAAGGGENGAGGSADTSVVSSSSSVNANEPVVESTANTSKTVPSKEEIVPGKAKGQKPSIPAWQLEASGIDS